MKTFPDAGDDNFAAVPEAGQDQLDRPAEPLVKTAFDPVKFVYFNAENSARALDGVPSKPEIAGIRRPAPCLSAGNAGIRKAARQAQEYLAV